MNSPARDDARAVVAELSRAEALLKDALNVVFWVRSKLDHPPGGFPVPASADDPDASSATRARRIRGGRGQPFKIDADPELRRYVEARIYAQTYQQIADDIAAHFPPERHVSRSSIARWWIAQRRTLPDHR